MAQKTAQITGNYALESSSNFDEFMKVLGVGLLMRKMGNMAKPNQKITEENGMWTIKTSSAFKTTEIIFKLGEEFSEITADGRVV